MLLYNNPGKTTNNISVSLLEKLSKMTSHGMGVPLPISAQVMEKMQAIRLDGCGVEDHSSLVKYYGKIANVIVERKSDIIARV